MDKGECGYLGCFSGSSGSLRGALGSQMVDLGCQGTDLVGGNDKDDSMRFYYEIASF